MSDEEHILISAVRYALGRRSYMVGVVASYANNKCKELSQQCKNIIARDIEEELDTYHRVGMTLGDECDEQTWLRLLEVLKDGK